MSPTTVVIPTRNRRRLLEAALRAVGAQEGGGVRAVVVDDGSTDDTAELLATAPDWVEVVRLPRAAGPSAARNAGLARVTTEWVAFCDDDDLWSPWKLRSQHAALAATPGARWCLAGVVAFDEGGRLLGHARAVAGDDLFARLLAANVVPGGGSGVLASTELVRAVGGFRDELRFGEDWDLWIRLARAAPAAAADRPLVGYRVWRETASSVGALGDALAVIESAYADDRRRLGVTIEPSGVELRRATEDAAAGRRLAAAHRFLRLGVGERNPRKAVLAMAALVAPRATHRRLAGRTAAQVPAAWADEVARWLPALLDAPAGSASR